MATIKDIAKHSGLGLATVSKYINGGKVKEKNRILLDAAIKELGYTVNSTARSLRLGRTNTIGVVLPQVNEIFRATILSYVEEILRDNGYSVLFISSLRDKERQCQAVKLMLSKQVEGIINIPLDNDGAHLMPAIEKNIPVVLIEYMIDGLLNAVNAVLVDNRKASEDAVQLLIDAGHRDIGILLGKESIPMDAQRLLGYKQALAKNNIAIQERLIRVTDYSVEGAYEGAVHLITREKPSVLYSANYYMTMGAIMAINNLHLTVPKDIAFIGFDNTPLSNVISPKLTIIEQPVRAIAKSAAKIMIAALNDSSRKPEIVMLDARIQMGESI